MNYSKYSPEWKDVIRPAILRRDGYKCVQCKVPHKAIVYLNTVRAYTVCDEFIEQWARANGKKVFTIYLQVAHLNHDKSDNRPENLRSLCVKCHSAYDREYRKIARKAFKGLVDKTPTPSVIVDPRENPELVKTVQDLVREFTGWKITRADARSFINAFLQHI